MVTLKSGADKGWNEKKLGESITVDMTVDDAKASEFDADDEPDASRCAGIQARVDRGFCGGRGGTLTFASHEFHGGEQASDVSLGVFCDVDRERDGCGLVTFAADLADGGEVLRTEGLEQGAVAVEGEVDRSEQLRCGFGAFAFVRDCGELVRSELLACEISGKPLRAAGEVLSVKSGRGCAVGR